MNGKQLRMKSAMDNDVLKRNFHAHVSYLLEMVIRKLQQSTVRSALKDALINDDIEKLRAALADTEGGRPSLSRLLKLSDPPWMFHLPPLCVAIHNGNLEIVDCLLKHGADPNQQGDASYDGSLTWYLSPLHFVFRDESEIGRPFRPEIAEMLIAAGGDINRPISLHREEEEEGGSMEFSTGNTHLHNCILQAQSPAIFDFLISHGADLLWKNLKDQTPLHIVTEYGRMWNAYFADTLIRRGGVTTDVDDTGGSVFLNLITHLSFNYRQDLYNTIMLLLQTGYSTEGDQEYLDEHFLLVLQTVFAMAGHAEEYSRLHDMIFSSHRHVQPLKHICRLKIRHLLGPQIAESKLSELGLPAALVNYLDFRDPV